MKIVILLTTIIILTLANPTLAHGDVQINVDGMSCESCAQSLKGAFKKFAEVKDINVNLETKMVTVHFSDDQTLDNETITKIITETGYSAGDINRAP